MSKRISNQVNDPVASDKDKVTAAINSHHVDVKRLAKKFLMELTATARLVDQAEAEFGKNFSNMILGEIALTRDEAAFYLRLVKQTGIDTTALPPSVDTKLPRLIGFLRVACDQFEENNHTPEEPAKANRPLPQPAPKEPPSAAKPRERKEALTDEQYRDLLRLSPSLLIKVKRGSLTYEEAMSVASA